MRKIPLPNSVAIHFYVSFFGIGSVRHSNSVPLAICTLTLSATEQRTCKSEAEYDAFAATYMA